MSVVTAEELELYLFDLKAEMEQNYTAEIEAAKAELQAELHNLRCELRHALKPKKPHPPAKVTRFVVPTVEEVAAYIKEKKFEGIDAEAFWNFYESKGWTVGKGKMKNWRAAVNSWNGRNKQSQSQPAHRPESERAKAETRKLLDELPEKAHDPESNIVAAYQRARREVYE